MIKEIFTLKNFLFTIKAFIAITLALGISLSLDLQKPMWALITVIFVQTKAETGLVIEKGIQRIVSSGIGIIVGFIIVNLFLPYPTLSIFFLCIFISITMYFSVGMSHSNFIYGLALANTTCSLIIFYSIANPILTTSGSIFYTGCSRFTEIVIGCLCSFLVNYYVFPVQIKDKLKNDATESLNLTIRYIKHVFIIKDFYNNKKYNKEVESILKSIIILDNELSASKYENYNSEVYNNFSIKIIELVQATHFLRKQARKNRQDIFFKKELNKISHDLSNFNSTENKPILKSNSKLISRVNAVIKSYHLIDENKPANSTNEQYFKFKNYNNIILTFLTISKTLFVLLLLTLFWINTQGNSDLLTMLIIPFYLAQLYIPIPDGTKQLKEVTVGMIISIPIAIFFTLSLLAQVDGYFELLILVLIASLFLPIMALTHPKFQAYSLGFCIGLIFIARPSNYMNFDIASALTIGLSAMSGCFVLWLTFKLYPHSPYTITRKLAIKSIIKSRKKLSQKEISKKQYQADLIKKILCVYENRKDDNSSERDIEFALKSLTKSI
ncbi:fusaric acid resistance protein [Francisella halioticida]|uniref:Fusaric acid resistance protein n=1 Tax=Francisella halioticida TaxID=549298 RepID=A0ABM6LZT9_9GAMM|nr:FUSC family protein [Francisella halioticida]ASG68060.1 fusaric acid resistance protein [Francisella halioticida]